MRKVVCILPNSSGGGLERNIELLKQYCDFHGKVSFESHFYAEGKGSHLKRLLIIFINLIRQKSSNLLVVSGGNINNVKVGFLCLLTRRKYLILQRNIWSNEKIKIFGSRKIYNLIYSIILSRSLKVLANSEAVCKDLQSNFPTADVGLLYNIMEPELLESKKLASTGHSFIAVGSNRPVKNYDYLIELWIKSGTSEKLKIIGNQVLELEEVVKKYGNTDNIELFDYSENILELMSNSKGLIHTSLSEGYSNALLNGALLQLPILSTECAGSAKEVLGERIFLSENLENDIVILRDWLENPSYVEYKQLRLLRTRHNAQSAYVELIKYL